jgi:hypothetical protein
VIDKSFVDFDPALKRSRSVHYDPIADNFVLESKYDVTDVIERNKALYNATDERARWGEMTLVGSIPLSDYYRLKAEGAIDADGEADAVPLMRILQDPAYRDWRTRPGRLI